MLSIVRKTIEQYNMLSPKDGVVIGLSGGMDSVSLLSALCTLKPEYDLSIYAVHINHNLRGEASKNDERLVETLCKSFDVPLFIYQADVMDYSHKHKIGIEEAGRKLRYQYLHQTMSELGAKKIAVGHNQNDNAETVMLNLFRGTGLRGLCGISPAMGAVIRPLLEVSRQEIEDYVNKHKLVFATDETNNSLDYNRNVIRNVLMPLIHTHFGNKTESVIAKNALLMRHDEDFLQDFSEKKSGMVSYQFPSKKVLSVEFILSQHVSIVRRVIRNAISGLRGVKALEDITASHIESIIDIARGRTGREASLPGFIARREYGDLILCIKQENQEYFHVLSPDSPVNISDITVTMSFDAPIDISHCTHSFNYDKVNMPLEIRTRRKGDKITLKGGTKKLKDYFIDTKTSRSKRDTTLLLAHGSDILWIMDKNNRINVAYQVEEGQKACWVIVNKGDKV